MEDLKFVGKKRIRNGKIYYEGEFFDSSDILQYEGKHGPLGKYGVATLYENGQKVYHGSFAKNERHGIGTEYDPDFHQILTMLQRLNIEEPGRNAVVYHGEWRKDKRHGEGQVWLRGVKIYHGQWKMNQRHGIGSEYSDDSRLLYSGHFQNNTRCGKGIQYMDSNNQNYLSGQFKNNTCHGKAQFFLQGKLIYEGMFRNGLPNGNGALYDYEHQFIIFEGKFKDGFSCAGGRSFNKNGYCTSSYSRTKQFRVPVLHLQKSCSIETLTIRQEMNLRNFLETGNQEKLNHVTTDFLANYTKEKYQIEAKYLHRDSILNILKTRYRAAKQTTTIEENIDLFGNEIQIPCFGNDNQIYDILSMEYLFLRNESGDFVNINYIYDNNRRVPNFPIMHDGQRLSSYFCPSLET